MTARSGLRPIHRQLKPSSSTPSPSFAGAVPASPAAAAATLLGVRRVGSFVLALLALDLPAHAATLSVRPADFSPTLSRLTVSASLSLPRQVGIELARRDGARIGWIVAPSVRQSLAIGWNGRIAGHRVPDGRYVVRLVYGPRVLATQPLRIDTTAPRLANLRIGNGSSRFAGDTRMLTTISPNGDRFRDVARVRFRLAEAAAVTLEVSRTVKTPRPFFTVTQRFRAGPQLMVWKPSPKLNPRTYLVRLFVRDGAATARRTGRRTRS